MKISKIVLSRISLYLASLIMICSIKPWFVWNSSTVLYVLLFLFIFIRFFLTRKINKKYSLLLILTFVLYTVIDIPHIVDIKRLIEYIFRHIISTSLIILLLYEERISLLKIFVNIYTWILAISIIIYIIILLGIPIYSYQVPINDPYYSWGFRNCIFLILPMTSLPFYRFQSIFLEPGHVGMISALVLYVIKYNIKSWQGFTLLLSSLLSMSLAAYVLLLLGIAIYKFSFRNLVRNVLLLLILLVTGTIISNHFPDSFFSQALLVRFEYDEDKGFKGNNRTSEDFDYYYENKFYNTKNILLGVGSDISKVSGDGGNSSYKVFIVQYGILGFIILSLFFVSIAFYSKSSFIRGLFFLYAASFWQRPYALWEVELFLYISIALLIEQDSELDLFGEPVSYGLRKNLY